MIFTTPELDGVEQRVLGEVEEIREGLQLHLRNPRRWYGSLRRLSFARALQGSNSIEGYAAALDDVVAVAAGEEPLSADDETRMALEGYRDAMTYVLQLAHDNEFSYSTQLIKSLHFMMTRHHLQNRPGQWRAGAIYVRREQSGEIVYQGPDLELVPGLMAEYVTALSAEDGAPDLVRAAMAHLNLVMIHPFRDGNGRMARCVQSLVLARAGAVSPVFLSIEEYLGRNTDDYYAVLARVGQGGWHPEHDARPWLRFALTAHLRQARTMLRRIKETERLWLELESLVAGHHLPERTIVALFDAAQGLRVRNSTYRAAIADNGGEPISLQTATRDLTLLSGAGLLTAENRARGRQYTGGARLAEVRRAITSARGARDDADPFAT